MTAHDVQTVRAFEHPGAGRKRAKATPKGRQVDPTAAHEIELLLGDRPRRRDLLIEHLHLIQDKYHQISAAHLAALADEMKLSFAEVFETATFYAHFDVVKEGEPDIAPLTIRVCNSLTCAMLGAEKLLHELQDSAGPGIRVVRAPCVGRCDTAPAAEVGHHFVDHATVDERARRRQGRRDPRASAQICRLRCLCRRWRLYAAESPALRRHDEGRPAQVARRRLAARARRRRLSDGTQSGARCSASLARG